MDRLATGVALMGFDAKFVANPNLKAELEKAMAGKMKQVNAELQRSLDRLGRSHKGQDMSAIRPALSRELSRLGLTMSPGEADRYAQCIRDGVHITAQPGRIR